MKRNKYTKANNIICKICNQKISSYGIVSHIKSKHNISVDDYVNRFGEFRKSKLYKKKNVRRINKMQCDICGNEYTTVGFSNHLRDSHNMTTNEYVDKYSEFRYKYKDYNQRALSNKIECKICKEIFGSERLLSYLIRIEHNITKIEYVKKYIFNNEIQYCKCGRGQKIKLLSQFPYKREYQSGHNPNGR